MSNRGIIDKSVIEVTCSNGHKVKKTIGELRRSPTFNCPQCGQPIEINGAELDRDIRKIERDLDDLFGR